jgi:hypothetical protein
LAPNSTLYPFLELEAGSVPLSHFFATWLCETLKWVSPRDLGARHTKTAGTLLPWSQFFRGGLSNEGMHVPDRVTWSFCTYRATNCLVKALPSELIKSERIGVLSLLGFNNLFPNQPLPWRALCPTFWILSATRRCSFSLEIYWASKSTAQLIFSIEN